MADKKKKEEDKIEIFVAEYLDCMKGQVNFEGIALQ